jgi:hypothetical protein
VLADGIIGEDEPLCLVDRGSELTAEKVDVVKAEVCVRATVDRVGTLLRGPGRSAENDGCAVMLVLLLEKPAGGAPELAKGREVSPRRWRMDTRASQPKVFNNFKSLSINLPSSSGIGARCRRFAGQLRQPPRRDFGGWVGKRNTVG